LPLLLYAESSGSTSNHFALSSSILLAKGATNALASSLVSKRVRLLSLSLKKGSSNKQYRSVLSHLKICERRKKEEEGEEGRKLRRKKEDEGGRRRP
jgi:hypothetical protein